MRKDEELKFLEGFRSLSEEDQVFLLDLVGKLASKEISEEQFAAALHAAEKK